MKNKTILRRIQRKKRIHFKMKGTTPRSRISVYRSSKYIYGQLIDDKKNVTLASASEKELKGGTKLTKVARAKEVGMLLGKKALAKKIREVVFDRSGYKYHGRVKAFAEGARSIGLSF